MKAAEHSEDMCKRLKDSDLSTTATLLTGLWRRGVHRAPDLVERRQHVRIPTDDLAQVTLGEDCADVRVMDVSRGGMRLRSPQLLSPGTSVRVKLGDTEVTAVVRYCIAADGAYWAGVQVQTGA